MVKSRKLTDQNHFVFEDIPPYASLEALLGESNKKAIILTFFIIVSMPTITDKADVTLVGVGPGQQTEDQYLCCIDLD